MEGHFLAGLPLIPVDGTTLCRSTRRILGRVKPGTTEDVIRIVQFCDKHRLSFHPISAGKNWGMGSYLPNSDNCILLDLSGLKAIGPLDRNACSVRLEAGVTQRELYQWLRHQSPEFAFNVTGSGENTSIVGNALERGIGYGGQRSIEFFGLEAVLADGSKHQPLPGWFSRTGNPPAGPQVEALLFQSNFGVVTAGWLKLRLKQEFEAAIVISGTFDHVFNVVAQAYRNNLLVLPTHMAGNSRAGKISASLLRQYLKREPSEAEIKRIFPIVEGHTALCAVHGKRRAVRAIIAEIKAIARSKVSVRYMNEARFAFAEQCCNFLGMRNKALFFATIKPLLRLTWGVPSDVGLAALNLKGMDSDPDHATEGCIYFNAVSALDINQSRAVEKIVNEYMPSADLTRCIINNSTIVHIFSHFFMSDDGPESSKIVQDVSLKLRAAGFPPYRLSVTNMNGYQAVPLSDRIGHTMNPRNIISPGHYAT